MAARKARTADVETAGGYVMRASISGTRDGVDWPKPGERVDLPEVEAADYLAAGLIEKAVVGTTPTTEAPEAPAADEHEDGASE